MFPCDYCDFKGNKMEIVTDHFKTKHINCYRITFWLCDQKKHLKMNEFQRHIGTYHYTPQY